MLLSRRKAVLGGAALSTAMVLGCQPKPAQEGLKPSVTIEASFSILASVLRALAGPSATVTSLAPADSDAHHFDPPPSAVLRLKDAALVASLGLGFDPWVDQLHAASGRADLLVQTAEGLEGLIQLPGGAHDPHVWSGPTMAARWVRRCATVLVERMPALADGMEARLTALLAALEPAQTASADLATLAADQPIKVVVGHASFGYLARETGIEFVGLHGLSHQVERGGAAMARLIDQLKATGAAACFPESISDPAELEELARQTGVRMGPKLFSDALSGPDGPAPDLPSLLMHNITALTSVLRT
jgi:zinc/manganese transport system substrate-binding protein